MPGGEVGELGLDRLEPRGHQVEEGRLAAEPERRPVELVVRDEAWMLAAAGAAELDLEHGGVRRARAAARGGGTTTGATRALPRSGHENVYRVVSASYMTPL